MPLELKIQERGGPARTQVVPGEMAFIGRREDNEVVLPFAFVSSRHGRIFRRDGALFVEDMGSTNGILVNGDPIVPMAPRALRPEDVLQIERIVIQARWAETGPEPSAEGATYHEALKNPAAATTPGPPVPRTPTRIEAPTTMLQVETGAMRIGEPSADPAGTARLAQASLPDVLASARLMHRLRTEPADEFGPWVLFFQAIGLLAILGGLVLFVLVVLA